MKLSTLWTSDAMTIGKHHWRIGVGIYRIGAEDMRCTFYEWRRIEDRHGMTSTPARAWRPDTTFPGYNGNDTYNGLPRTLARLYEREQPTVRALIDGNYATELTAEGEQAVIPGCEHNAAPGVRQLSLFG